MVEEDEDYKKNYDFKNNMANGIAYDPVEQMFYVSGKRWNMIFKLDLTDGSTRTPDPRRKDFGYLKDGKYVEYEDKIKFREEFEATHDYSQDVGFKWLDEQYWIDKEQRRLEKELLEQKKEEARQKRREKREKQEREEEMKNKEEKNTEDNNVMTEL